MTDSTEDTMSSSSSVLTDLCSICHMQPPKYRCPRCSTRTCSLPCSRRHKLWSECSGVRDPAAYLRRSELATESAFDRDFNFITSIERSLERAERDVENRGMTIDRDRDAVVLQDLNSNTASQHERRNQKRKRGTKQKDNDGLAKGELALLRGVGSAGVRLVRAPKGMSRRKQNMSRWLPRSKCLTWTVEWILPSGEKTTRNYPETVSIANAYDRVVPPPSETTTSNRKLEDVPPLQGEQEAQPERSHGDSTVPPAQVSQEDSATAQNTSSLRPELQPQLEKRLPPTSRSGVHFYLHRPQTATKQPVLIPLSPHLTISESLRGRTVLEFPTVYVLNESPEDIKTGCNNEAKVRGASKESVSDSSMAQSHAMFLLEEDYAEQIGGGDPPSVPAVDTSTDEEDTSSDGGSSDSDELENVDEGKVLEVLSQDLSAT